tara:strand:- start:95 stop:733 length:639 start_codon:yes stop_codon:yes gene_type:complete
MNETAAIWINIQELQPWDKNPRNNANAIPKIADSIKRFGFANPIIARKEDNTIIAGHTRYEAAKSLGLEKVPVRFMDLDPADAKLLALADNKLSEISSWDFGKIKDVFEELGDVSIDLHTIGFNEKELESILFADYDFNFEEGETDFQGTSDEFEENSEEQNALKIVQIYFEEEDYEEFQEQLNFLSKKLETDNNTDTIIKSVAELVKTYTK